MRRRIITIALCCLAAYLIYGTLLASMTVPTGTMAPTIPAGSTIMVNKCTYGISPWNLVPFGVFFDRKLFFTWSRPTHGDVVVYDHTMANGFGQYLQYDATEFRIGRVAALSGDVVEVRRCTLYVNGQPMISVGEDELLRYADTELHPVHRRAYTMRPYRLPSAGDTIRLTDPDDWTTWARLICQAGHDVDTRRQTIDGRAVSQFTLDEECCFIVGDDRANSHDSRYLGPVAIRRVLGATLYGYPPPATVAHN